MYWSYKYISKKFLSEVKDAWTVKDVVEKTAVLGDQIYLIYAPSGESYTYEQSNRLSNKIAHSLMKIGLRKGDRVGIYMSNRPEYIFTLFAVGKTGMIEVPINTNLRRQEIAHIVKKARISTIFVESHNKFLETLSQVAAQVPGLENVIILGDAADLPPLSQKVYFLSQLMEAADDINPAVEVLGSDDYSIIFTSGTTGLPKGAVISNKTFILAALSGGAMPVSRESRNYTCLPLFHTNAQVYSTMTYRCLGGSLVLSDRFSPQKFWQEIIKYQASSFNSIGGMMQILDSAFTHQEVPAHPARCVLVGGTPAALWERFEKKFGVDIYEGYSMSEAPVVFLNIHPDKEKRKIGSFGKPVFSDLGRRFKVVNDNNEEIKAGTGELLQRGEGFITKGYWNAPEADAEAFDDGWFHTGDVVRLDEDGYFYFVDRNKFMIRVAGENVSAFEVEDIVNSYPAVAQSAAIPVPDPIRDEEIKVLIKLKEGVQKLDFEELIRHCATHLAYFKVPRYLEVVEDFPKTATERIQKVLLKEREKQKEDHDWDRNKEIPHWKSQFFGSV